MLPDTLLDKSRAERLLRERVYTASSEAVINALEQYWFTHRTPCPASVFVNMARVILRMHPENAPRMPSTEFVQWLVGCRHVHMEKVGAARYYMPASLEPQEHDHAMIEIRTRPIKRRHTSHMIRPEMLTALRKERHQQAVNRYRRKQAKLKNEKEDES